MKTFIFHRLLDKKLSFYDNYVLVIVSIRDFMCFLPDLGNAVVHNTFLNIHFFLNYFSYLYHWQMNTFV